MAKLLLLSWNFSNKIVLKILLISINCFDFGQGTPSRSILNGGVYKIQNDSDQMVLTAVDNGLVGRVLGKVQSQPWKTVGLNDDQKWTIRTSPVSGKDLRTLTSRKNTNNNISLDLKNSSTTLRYWEFVAIGQSPGKWQIKTFPSDKCLQSMGRDKNVEEKPCLTTARSQKWEILICNSNRCSERSA